MHSWGWQHRRWTGWVSKNDCYPVCSHARRYNHSSSSHSNLTDILELITASLKTASLISNQSMILRRKKWPMCFRVCIGILTVAVLLSHSKKRHIPLSVFHPGLSLRVLCRTWIAVLFMVMEDAFHVGSQPQEKTSHTPVPLTGWVIELGQNGCGGWEEARPVIGYHLPG